MTLNPEITGEINAIIARADRILLISHKSPDGDTLGASLGLYQVFKNMGKIPEIFCVDAPADVFKFMPNIEQIKTGQLTLSHDVIMILDAGAPHLTGIHETHPQLFDKSLPVINIDHHPTNNGYGILNLVFPDAASATLIIFELISALGWPLDRHTATCLLTGLYTDTGSFMHSNTTPEALRIASKLLAKGANARAISKEIFNTLRVSTMRIWGCALKSLHQTQDGITMSVITQNDFEECQADYEEISGVVDLVNSIPGALYSVMLTEREGKVKGSLRTLKNEINVSDIASAYGGGGHAKAAGFTLPGSLQKEVRWKVVEGM